MKLKHQLTKYPSPSRSDPAILLKSGPEIWLNSWISSQLQHLLSPRVEKTMTSFKWCNSGRSTAHNSNISPAYGLKNSLNKFSIKIKKKKIYQGFFVTITLPLTHSNFGCAEDFPFSFKIWYRIKHCPWSNFDSNAQP